MQRFNDVTNYPSLEMRNSVDWGSQIQYSPEIIITNEHIPPRRSTTFDMNLTSKSRQSSQKDIIKITCAQVFYAG